MAMVTETAEPGLESLGCERSRLPRPPRCAFRFSFGAQWRTLASLARVLRCQEDLKTAIAMSQRDAAGAVLSTADTLPAGTESL